MMYASECNIVHKHVQNHYILILQFIYYFTDILSFIIKLEKVLIVGDFNIHVYDAHCKVVDEF